MLFEIYAGLSGGFGGAKYVETIEFPSYEEAEDYALELAIEEYQGYEGLHGIRSISEIMEDEGLDEDDAELEYLEERDSWLDYYVEEIDEDEEEDDYEDEDEDED